MPTRTVDIRQSAGGAESVTSRFILSGEKFALRFQWKDRDGAAQDISGFTITATARFRTATITEGGAGSIPVIPSYRQPNPGIPDRVLDSGVTTAADGIFTVDIPEDLWPEATNPITENSNEDVPLVIVTITVANADDSRIWKFRHLILIRFGG